MSRSWTATPGGGGYSPNQIYPTSSPFPLQGQDTSFRDAASRGQKIQFIGNPIYDVQAYVDQGHIVTSPPIPPLCTICACVALHVMWKYVESLYKNVISILVLTGCNKCANTLYHLANLLYVCTLNMYSSFILYIQTPNPFFIVSSFIYPTF